MNVFVKPGRTSVDDAEPSSVTIRGLAEVIVERTLSKILVVDDDEGVTQTFARMLRLEGFQVRTAMNAEKGLQAVSETHADAIILDLRMPLVDGVGFLRRLRAQQEEQKTPVAIVTGDYFL